MLNSRFASRLATLAVALSLAFAAGCAKSKTDVVLNKDGSGTVSDAGVVDMSKMDELMEMFKSMAGGMEGAEGGGPQAEMEKKFDEATNPEKLKAKLQGKKGVELVSATRTDDAEKKTRTAEHKIKFATLEDYFRCGIEESVHVKLAQGPGGVWTFSRRMIRKGLDDAEGGMAEEQAGMLEMVKGMIEPYVSGLELSAVMAVPGTVVETNGTKNEAGTSVTWKMSFDAMFDKKAIQQVVSFKGEGLTLKAFELTIDDDGKITDGAPAPAAPVTPAEPVAPPR